MKKKIAIITLHLNYGGVERATTNLANMLCENYDVTIVNMYNSNIAYKFDDKVKILTLSNYMPNREDFKKAVKNKNFKNIFIEGIKSIKILYERISLVKKHLLTNNYDYVISTRQIYTELINKLNISAVKIAIEHKHHNNDTKYINYIKNQTNNLDYLILVSKELTNFYKSICKTKCIYIPNAIDNFEDINNVDISKKDKSIIAVGRLSKEKGFSDLIDIYYEVIQKHPEYNYKIIGDGDEKENLINKIKQLGIEKYVQLPGFLDKEKLNKEYIKSKIYVMSSFEESFGLVALEAQSFKLPVCTFSSATGVIEILNGTGIVVENRNKEEMSKQIISLIEDDKKYLSYIEPSYDNAKKYTIDNVKKIWLNFFNNI